MDERPFQKVVTTAVCWRVETVASGLGCCMGKGFVSFGLMPGMRAPWWLAGHASFPSLEPAGLVSCARGTAFTLFQVAVSQCCEPHSSRRTAKAMCKCNVAHHFFRMGVCLSVLDYTSLALWLCGVPPDSNGWFVKGEVFFVNATLACQGAVTATNAGRKLLTIRTCINA